MKMAFKASTSGSTTYYNIMKFKLAKYALNGTWLGFEDLSTQLMYCNMSVPYTDKGAGTSRTTRWLKFGYNADQTYTCNFSTLIYQETFFYDLYLVDYVSLDQLLGSMVMAMSRGCPSWGETTDEQPFEVDF